MPSSPRSHKRTKPDVIITINGMTATVAEHEAMVKRRRNRKRELKKRAKLRVAAGTTDHQSNLTSTSISGVSLEEYLRSWKLDPVFVADRELFHGDLCFAIDDAVRKQYEFEAWAEERRLVREQAAAQRRVPDEECLIDKVIIGVAGWLWRFVGFPGVREVMGFGSGHVDELLVAYFED